MAATNPTSALGVQNWFQTTLASSIGSTDTTISLNATPTPSEGYLIIDPDNTSTREVVHYTSVGGGAVTLPGTGDRGVDGTTAQAHAQNVTVRMEFTSSHYTALQSGFALKAAAVNATVLTNPYKFSVYRNSAWNTGTGSQFNVVQFDTKTFDTSSNVDIVTNKGRFTAPVAGFYFFAASIGTSTTNIWLIAGLRKNGTEVKKGTGVLNASGAINAYNTVSGLIQLAANDYVEASLYSNTSTQGGLTGASETYFDGYLVSPT